MLSRKKRNYISAENTTGLLKKKFLSTIFQKWQNNAIQSTQEIKLVEPGIQNTCVNFSIHSPSVWKKETYNQECVTIDEQPGTIKTIVNSVDKINRWLGEWGNTNSRVNFQFKPRER